ncbi:hypothetical protein QCA50_006659 [Cerrena zonata]|uniref:FHA domain-containing protein n=1 Tax=Cerrena zonata TaxID=2478898 RepID=A0AAW0GKE0_9APHY
MAHGSHSPSRSDNYRRDRDSGTRRDEDSRKYRDNDRRRDSEKYKDRDDYRRRDDDRREGSSRGQRRREDGDRKYKDSRDSRGGSLRRSASPRNRASRPRSKSKSGSRSPSPEDKDKGKPNFKPSGLLAAETKTVKHGDGSSTVLKYHEPPEARKPTMGWRLYVFKGAEQVDLLHIHRQSAYLFGRDKTVVDIPLDHPSSSKQHAVIQYRQITEKNEYGEQKRVIKPFIIDLESTNGTHVNGEQIPESRYYELKLSDIIKFGESNREYVLLSEDAA